MSLPLEREGVSEMNNKMIQLQLSNHQLVFNVETIDVKIEKSWRVERQILCHHISLEN